MIRIRFHGRGGHGIKTAGRIVGTAAFLPGHQVQDSPVYGAGRRGAAVTAFTRISDEPILQRGLTTLRLIHKVLGENLVIVNAAGCMTLLGTYPFTPLNSSWLYTTMASAPAGAQGVRDALDILKAKGKLAADDDLKVLVLAGDGSTYDMGLSATSAAIHRGLDFWYLCYDNEAYGNTGFQLSSGSPEGSHTSTSLVEGQQRKKDIFEIWRAHHPAYIATVSAHESVDLAEKVRRSMSITGPKLFLSLAVCPTGWGFEPEMSDELAHLAVETGIWPLKEAVAGNVRHTYMPNRFRPVSEYLEPQRRFRHLFQPQRDAAMLARIQAEVHAYWSKARSAELAERTALSKEQR